MRSLVVVLFLAATVAAEDKKPEPVKNESLIRLLTKLKTSKNRAETLKDFAKANRLDPETEAFVAKLKPNEAASYSTSVDTYLKAKRLPEAKAALDVTEAICHENAQALDRGTGYFGAAFMADDFKQLADWRLALGQKGDARDLYVRAVDCYRRQQHYHIAQGQPKANEAVLKEIYDTLDRIRSDK
ncbi:MAG: hypothetical protein KBC95_03920 [Candidatus Peribacteraceae bacterium]|nr:hypothetical protein [Candidatus Peribacteraceae bacterium]